MNRRKKLIVGAVLVAVLLFGSLGGIVLADDDGDNNQPGVRCGAFVDEACEIYNSNPDRPSDIDCGVLKDACAQARGEMWGECPEGRPHFLGPMTQAFESLGVDQEAVQDAFGQARVELEDGTLEGGRRALMARVLEILEIDEEDWQATCAEAGQANRFGFKGHGGFRMGGMRGFNGPCAPAE